MIAALFGLALLATPVVATSEGPIVGTQETDGSVAFRGVPYAQPPVGPLRWTPPKPIRWSAPRPATTPGRACPQSDYGSWNRHDAETGAEDCLTLELRTPSLHPDHPLPVMVWIHGGGNRGGSGVGTIASDLVSHDIVLVDFNYRLGALGFLSHPALSAEAATHGSGNYGLMDQQAALRWVQANIARFGGDPMRVTIFGESAGAQDVGLQLLIPSSRGLFARAIAESGTPAFGVTGRSLGQAETLGERLVRLAGAPPEADAAALRRLPVEALLHAADTVHEPSLGDDSFLWLQITADGMVLLDLPERLLAANRNPAPLLIGTNAQEFSTADIRGDARDVIRRRFGRNATMAFAHYGISPTGTVPDAQTLLLATDLVFRCPAEVVASDRGANGQATWVYRFDHQANDGKPVAHGSEIEAVLGKGSGGAAAMQDLWLAFARTGVPEAPGLPSWPPFSENRRTVMQFGHDAAVVRIEADPICPLTNLP